MYVTEFIAYVNHTSNILLLALYPWQGVNSLLCGFNIDMKDIGRIENKII